MTKPSPRLILGVIAVAAAVAIVTVSIPANIRAVATTEAARGNASPIVARLSVTNGTKQDFAFYFYLQVRTKSGWSQAPNQPEGAGVMRYFVKGQADHLKLELPKEAGLYRFTCGYEPLMGKPRALVLFDWLYGVKLPGSLGVGYHQALVRFKPWPKHFFSNTFEVAAYAQQGAANRR